MTTPHKLADLSAALGTGAVTSEALTERCLAAISDPEGEGARAFLHVNAVGALATARAIDRMRAAGVVLSPFAGIPISVKDLFDIAGEVTRAGSTVLGDNAPAVQDAPVVARLRRAGLVVIGRTNMTEFAFSGLGLNPHFGTPAAPWDRAARRIPGGSSSGAAISVSDGMCFGALGTDTGGSCRIPAAFTGLVGFKPTARRVPLNGSVPLSPSLDSAGPIGLSVACCATLDAIMAGEDLPDPATMGVAGLRIAVIENYVTENLEATVAAAFERAIDHLSREGAVVSRLRIPVLERIAQINAGGGFAAAESYAWHRALLERRADGYDPRVRTRIERGREQSASDYLDLIAVRIDFIKDICRSIGDFDAVAMPTVPIVPPRIADLADDAAYSAINLLALRNPSVVNMFDGCAISLPVGDPGAAPVGLTLATCGGKDRHLLRVAQAVEHCLGSAISR
ncbi:MAG: amidase [Sphingobium sp.]